MRRTDLKYMTREQELIHLPNGESDPRKLNVGRGFDVNWLFVFSDDEAPVEADTVVYEVFESFDERKSPNSPCYVGVTGDFPMRWVTHRSRSWWFPHASVSGVILHGYESPRPARGQLRLRREAERTHPRLPTPHPRLSGRTS